MKWWVRKSGGFWRVETPFGPASALGDFGTHGEAMACAQYAAQWCALQAVVIQRERERQ